MPIVCFRILFRIYGRPCMFPHIKLGLGRIHFDFGISTFFLFFWQQLICHLLISLMFLQDSVLCLCLKDPSDRLCVCPVSQVLLLCYQHVLWSFCYPHCCKLKQLDNQVWPLGATALRQGQRLLQSSVCWALARRQSPSSARVKGAKLCFFGSYDRTSTGSRTSFQSRSTSYHIIPKSQLLFNAHVCLDAPTRYCLLHSFSPNCVMSAVWSVLPCSFFPLARHMRQGGGSWLRPWPPHPPDGNEDEPLTAPRLKEPLIPRHASSHNKGTTQKAQIEMSYSWCQIQAFIYLVIPLFSLQGMDLSEYKAIWVCHLGFLLLLVWG